MGSGRQCGVCGESGARLGEGRENRDTQARASPAAFRLMPGILSPQPAPSAQPGPVSCPPTAGLCLRGSCCLPKPFPHVPQGAAQGPSSTETPPAPHLPLLEAPPGFAWSCLAPAGSGDLENRVLWRLASPWGPELGSNPAGAQKGSDFHGRSCKEAVGPPEVCSSSSILPSSGGWSGTEHSPERLTPLPPPRACPVSGPLSPLWNQHDSRPVGGGPSMQPSGPGSMDRPAALGHPRHHSPVVTCHLSSVGPGSRWPRPHRLRLGGD